MNFWNAFDSLFSNFGNLTWQMVVMWGIGALLIYLAIAKKMEPSLLLPMGFGAVLVNLPLSGAITQGDTEGPISALFEAGMSNELFPLLLFIGKGNDPSDRKLHVLPDRQDVELFSFLTSCIRAPGTVFL